MKITREQAIKAKEVLLEYVKQELGYGVPALNLTDSDECRYGLLFIALTQEYFLQ